MASAVAAYYGMFLNTLPPLHVLPAPQDWTVSQTLTHHHSHPHHAHSLHCM